MQMHQYTAQNNDIGLGRGTTIAMGVAAGANAVIAAAVNAPGALTFDYETLAEIAKTIALTATPIALIACWVAGVIAQAMRPVKVVTTLLVGTSVGACAQRNHRCGLHRRSSTCAGGGCARSARARKDRTAH